MFGLYVNKVNHLTTALDACDANEDIPDEYVTIKSGLGNSNPTAILITPIKKDERILGVIELASFNEIEPHQIEFVSKIAENTATVILSTLANEKTAHLDRPLPLRSNGESAIAGGRDLPGD